MVLAAALKINRWYLVVACALCLGILAIPITLAFRSHPAALLLAQIPTLKTTQAAPRTAQIKTGDVKKSLILDGELRAVRAKTIFAPATNQTKILYLPPEGSLVKVGDKLVEFDGSSIVTRIKEVETQLVSAENRVVELKGQQESALRDMEIELSRLWLTNEQARIDFQTYANVPKQLVSRRELQEKQLAFEKAKTEFDNQTTKIEQKKKEQAAELRMAEIEVGKLKFQVEQTKLELNQLTITADTDGIVVYSTFGNERRKFQIGDTVGWGASVLQLPDLTRMEAVLNVNEVDGQKLAVGQKTAVVLDSYPDQTFSGTVKEISQTALKLNPTTTTKIFKTVVSLDQTLPDLMKPGMSARISIEIGTSGTQLIVPRETVQFQNDVPQVTKVESTSQYRPIQITILATDVQTYAIAPNPLLKEGDRLVAGQ